MNPYSTPPLVTIKQGDDLSLVCQSEVDGIPQVLDNITIAAQLRSGNYILIADFAVTKLQDTNGDLTFFELKVNGTTTKSAPIGPAVVDIVYICQDGTTDASPTFVVQINKRVTTP